MTTPTAMTTPTTVLFGLQDDHRRWILLNAIGMAAAMNAGVNAALAWVSSAGSRVVPMASLPIVGGPSTLTDTLGTLFVLPFVTTLMVTLAVRRERRLARLAPFQPDAQWQSVVGRLPTFVLGRAAVSGSVCLAVVGPVAALAVVGLRFGDITPAAFVSYKVFLGVGLGLLITPLVAVFAMAEPGVSPQ